jgi:hypothetical protein
MIYDNNHKVTIAPGSYPGLSEAIADAGYALECNNDVWYADDAAAVQAIIDSFTAPDLLSSVKADKCREVLLHSKRLRDKVVELVSKGEMASWSIKRDSAIRYDSEGDAGAPYAMLSDEAAKRGISLAALVAKVHANAARFEAAESAIGGTDGKHRDAIMALETVEAVVAYDYSTGWPEV